MDLEALMVKAQDLVHLAAELNEKLVASNSGSASHSATPPPARTPSAPSSTSLSTSSLFTTTPLVPSSEPEEAKFIRSSLAQLGLQLSNAPVTADMIQDERTWMEELARELARVLQGSVDEGPEQKTGGIMKERGIIGLDEVWGGWNRARGVGELDARMGIEGGRLTRPVSAYPTINVFAGTALSANAYLPTNPQPSIQIRLASVAYTAIYPCCVCRTAFELLDHIGRTNKQSNSSGGEHYTFACDRDDFGGGSRRGDMQR